MLYVNKKLIIIIFSLSIFLLILKFLILRENKFILLQFMILKVILRVCLLSFFDNLNVIFLYFVDFQFEFVFVR